MKSSCAECPFRRKAAAGWLGESEDAQDFLSTTSGGELLLPCHMAVDWEADDKDEQVEEAPKCFGHRVFLRNQCKIPRNPEAARLVGEVEADRVNYFSNVPEFIKHHDGGRK